MGNIPMNITDYTIYDKHITKEMKKLTDADIAARQKAQSSLMNEDAFAIVFDGVGTTEFVFPRYFDGTNAVHLHALAIALFMEILSCTGCTRKFLGMTPNDETCGSNDDEAVIRRNTIH